MQAAMVHNVLHSLALKGASFQLASKILRMVWQMWYVSEVTIIPLLSSCRVRWWCWTDTQLRDSDGQDQDPAEALGTKDMEHAF